MINEALGDLNERMRASVRILQDDLASIRTGRASPALVEKMPVMYYEQPTPLNQLAVTSAPEPRLLTIRPFDPSSINDIERAIQASDLGLTPNNDGKIIRLIIPALTEERRRELTRLVGSRVEEARVAIRNIRRDILSTLREFKRDKLISEDEFARGDKAVQAETDKYVNEVSQIEERKQDEIMEI